jgi:hypothetical protein
MKIPRKILYLILSTVVLSSCGIVHKDKQSKINDTDLANVMKKYDNICSYVTGGWGDDRWQSFAKSEARSRG